MKKLEIMNIPDGDNVYMRVHHQNIILENNKKVILPIAFDIKGDGGLSVNWDKFSSPESTQSGARKPQSNNVISMKVEKIRKLDSALDVKHVPLDDNYSHSEIFNIPPRKPNGMKVRVQLMDLSKWVLECDNL